MEGGKADLVAVDRLTVSNGYSMNSDGHLTGPTDFGSSGRPGNRRSRAFKSQGAQLT